MKRLIKVVLGFTALATFGNAVAETVNSDVTLTALVASSCNTATVFIDQDLSTQIDANGGINEKTANGGHVPPPLPITNGNITCNVDFTTTTMKMVSLNKGIKSGGVTLPYTIKGTLGSVSDHAAPITLTPLTDAQVTDFDSATGPYTDLLHTATTPTSLPSLTVTLNDQPSGTAIAGNYADTLTITIMTTL